MNDFFNINVIGFDADDTLWINETFFREAEDHFCRLMSPFETENKTRQELQKFEIQNLGIYGYGIKGFILSMLECAQFISNQNLPNNIYTEILNIGKDMLNKPVDLLPGVRETLKIVASRYRVLLLTKGDLLDQERKLEKSGLSQYFHHVEVLSNKYSKNYSELLDYLSIKPTEFLMVGNSLRSDILPIIEIGASAVHIPFHTTWEHEMVVDPPHEKYLTLNKISELLNYIAIP